MRIFSGMLDPRPRRRPRLVQSHSRRLVSVLEKNGANSREKLQHIAPRLHYGKERIHGMQGPEQADFRNSVQAVS